jgi:pimeloyl-ACP methyl ester carboxylesterase
MMRDHELHISQDVISDLQRRLDNVRWPATETVNDWSQGVPTRFMRDLCQYWGKEYDWRRCEDRLNALGEHVANLDGLDIHFLHVRSPNPKAMPMIMTHGWPGSIIEFMKVIGPLTDPVAHGGKAEDAFHLVLPSLPGYGFSAKPTESGWHVRRIAKCWVALMRELGYERFVAQGGDWGASVTTSIGGLGARECIGIHVNMPIAFPDEEDLKDPGPDGEEALRRLAEYQKDESGYASQQGTRPQTLGYGLADSPVGQAAWIVEKFRAWSDCSGDLWSVFSKDEILDNIMMYWLGNAGASSARLYWESLATGFSTHSTPIWTGCSLFPKELFAPPRRWAEKQYTNLQYWSEVERGGHFAAMEQPDIFVSELRSCFSALR